jgi:hypothetical protein
MIHGGPFLNEIVRTRREAEKIKQSLEKFVNVIQYHNMMWFIIIFNRMVFIDLSTNHMGFTGDIGLHRFVNLRIKCR